MARYGIQNRQGQHGTVHLLNSQLLAIYYKGTVAVTAEVQKVVSSTPDATTTDYGNLCMPLSIHVCHLQ